MQTSNVSSFGKIETDSRNPERKSMTYWHEILVVVHLNNSLVSLFRFSRTLLKWKKDWVNKYPCKDVFLEYFMISSCRTENFWMERDVGAALECQNQNVRNIKGKDIPKWDEKKLAVWTDSSYFSDFIEFWYLVLSQCLSRESRNQF